MIKRGSGILIHISSLDSPFGIGDLGPKAYEFIDFLEKSKQDYWQVLPLNPTNLISCNSPYSSASAFAVNTLLISPELLVEDGLLSDADLKIFEGIDNHKVDYQAVSLAKEKILNKAFENLKNSSQDERFGAFLLKHSYWLDDFADFMVFKKCFDLKCWSQWPDKIRDRDIKAVEKLRQENNEAVLREKFFQYIFFSQWYKLREYANRKNVRIIGDMPIYVTYDSVDAWTNSEIFKIDEHKNLKFLAGVPPDYFSATGQLWGNPVYDWEALKRQDYQWWIKRVRHNLDLFDLVRIDHFRGFVDFWQVPAGEKTAINGQWEKAPAYDFFNKLTKEFPDMPILAEDLGIITDEVRQTMKDFSFPGMKILEFAFYEDLEKHPYLPHNYTENCAAYTGTHDNNTLKGWFDNELKPEDKQKLYHYINARPSSDDMHWALIELLMRSAANLVIIPVQDVLGLDQSNRMNVPGVADGNWQWRVNSKALDDGIAARLRKIVVTTNR